MYVYNCNAIPTTVMKERSDKDMIRAFTYLKLILNKPRNPPRFTFHGQLSIYRLKADNDDHEHQVQAIPFQNFSVRSQIVRTQIK